MPLRLSKPPDPTDPEYQSLERRVNFALHGAIYAASNSCLWFARSISYADWEWPYWVSALWATFLLGHGIWVFSQEKPRNA